MQARDGMSVDAPFPFSVADHGLLLTMAKVAWIANGVQPARVQPPGLHPPYDRLDVQRSLAERLTAFPHMCNPKRAHLYRNVDLDQ